MFELHVAGCAAPALVDDAYAHLCTHRWRLDKDGYVMRKSKGARIYLHHLVLPGQRYPAFVRDHIDRNKLNNQSSNLRWLTIAESNQNKGAQRRNHIGVRGVTLNGSGYQAVVGLNGQRHRLGTYRTVEEAAQVAEQWRTQNMPFAA